MMELQYSFLEFAECARIELEDVLNRNNSTMDRITREQLNFDDIIGACKAFCDDPRLKEFPKLEAEVQLRGRKMGIDLQYQFLKSLEHALVEHEKDVTVRRGPKFDRIVQHEKALEAVINGCPQLRTDPRIGEFPVFAALVRGMTEGVPWRFQDPQGEQLWSRMEKLPKSFRDEVVTFSRGSKGSTGNPILYGVRMDRYLDRIEYSLRVTHVLSVTDDWREYSMSLASHSKSLLDAVRDKLDPDDPRADEYPLLRAALKND